MLKGQNYPITIAEKSGFETTANYADVQEFINELAKKSKNFRVETIAKSTEGRIVPLMIIADPMPESPADLRDDKRIVVYIQANIHAGEVEGKEASLMLARDLVSGLNSDILKKVIVLICPNFNPDGNEAISVKNRIHQNGPKNGVGLRYNGQMLDLNRDAIKLETPEMQGLIRNVIRKWDPSVTIDCHTTNGSFHEEPVTFTWMMNPAGNRGLINYMRDKMMPDISKVLKEKYNVLNCFYGEFNDMLNPDSGWVSYASEPRYLVNYLGVRNRLAILNENYVYADYKSRVLGCYSLLHAVLEYSSDHADEIKDMIRNVDLMNSASIAGSTDYNTIPIEYEVQPTPQKVTVRAFEVVPSDDTSSYYKVRKTDKVKPVTIPYFADYYSTKNIALPYTYLLKMVDPSVVNLLMTHGIRVEKLTEPVTLEVEAFRISDLKPAARLNQGHYTNIVKGRSVTDTVDFVPGNYVVYRMQPLASLAAYMLEPQTNDALILWNFFDRYLVPQWGKGFYPYPVYRLMTPINLRTSVVDEN